MELRILPRASTNGRGPQHIVVGVVLALLLIWFYRDYVDMEMILRILWFTFCMMLHDPICVMRVVLVSAVIS